MAVIVTAAVSITVLVVLPLISVLIPNALLISTDDCLEFLFVVADDVEDLLFSFHLKLFLMKLSSRTIGTSSVSVQVMQVFFQVDLSLTAICRFHHSMSHKLSILFNCRTLVSS